MISILAVSTQLSCTIFKLWSSLIQQFSNRKRFIRGTYTSLLISKNRGRWSEVETSGTFISALGNIICHSLFASPLSNHSWIHLLVPLDLSHVKTFLINPRSISAQPFTTFLKTSISMRGCGLPPDFSWSNIISLKQFLVFSIILTTPAFFVFVDTHKILCISTFLFVHTLLQCLNHDCNYLLFRSLLHFPR